MNKLYRYIITGVITTIVLFLVWYFGDIVKYLLISVVLSIIGKPLVDVLRKIHYKGKTFPKWLASMVALLLLWGVMVAFIWIFIPLLVTKINVLSTYNLADVLGSFNDAIVNLEVYLKEKFAIDITQGGKSLSDVIVNRIANRLTPSLIGISMFIDTLSTFVIGAFSVSFITFFFLKEADLFNRSFIILFPKRYEVNIQRALNSSISLLSRYFIGLIIESSIKLIVISLSLYLMGFSLPDSLIIGLISAILNVIPYIGPLIGAVIGIMIGIVGCPLGLDVYQVIFHMSLVFALFQLVDNIIIQPYIYSSSVKAHPLEIFIVILMAGSIAGIMGMLLAIPAYTVIRVFAKEFFTRLRIVQKLTENI